MARTYARWSTEVEAAAFRAGVEHANDRALTVEAVYPDGHPTTPWVVLMHDADAEEDADPAQDLPESHAAV